MPFEFSVTLRQVWAKKTTYLIVQPSTLEIPGWKAMGIFGYSCFMLGFTTNRLPGSMIAFVQGDDSGDRVMSIRSADSLESIAALPSAVSATYSLSLTIL